MRWFPIALFVVFDSDFSFSSWWVALPNLIPHHTVSYIQPLTLMHWLPTYYKPGDDADLTTLDTPWVYILHGDQSFHSSCNPCQRTHSTKNVKYEGDLEMVACPPHCEVNAGGWIWGAVNWPTTIIIFCAYQSKAAGHEN